MNLASTHPRRFFASIVTTAIVIGLLGSASSARADEDYECLLEAHVDVSVSSAVPGVVEKVLVERGERVKKGEILVQLVRGIELAAHELAEARAQFADRTNQRNADLVEERLISSNEKDALETDALLAKLEEREAREVLKLRTIRSPIEGIVVDVSVAAGEFVDEVEILRIVQIDPLNVEVVVPVSLYGQIARGSVARVRPEAPFDRDFDARVVIVDRVVDAASGTFGLRLELPNAKRDIPAGLKCVVRFPSADVAGRADSPSE